MKHNYVFQPAPSWLKPPGPRKFELSVVLINMPQDECYVVATSEEINAIADPNSFVGRLLRGHCALMALRYLSNN